MERPRLPLFADSYLRFGITLTLLCERLHITHRTLRALTRQKNGVITAIKKGYP